MRYFAFVVSAWTVVCPCGAAFGQERHWEITPFGGFQFGGDFDSIETDEDFDLDESAAYGFMVDVELDAASQIEVYFSRQETELEAEGGDFAGSSLFDVDVNYLHVGGTLVWDYGVWEPFVVGTMGLTHFDPDFSGSDTETRFSMALGGGVKVMPTESIGFRFEGRGFATFVDSDTSVFCGDGCEVYFSSDLFTQFQVTAGLVFRF